MTFVNADSRVTSILEASKSDADAASDTANYGPADLENSSGSGTSEGFTNRTVTFYARYWDPGAENMGYGAFRARSPTRWSFRTLPATTCACSCRWTAPPRAAALASSACSCSSADAGRGVAAYQSRRPGADGLSGTFARIGSTNGVNLTPARRWANNDMGRLTTTGTLPVD